MYDLKKRSLMTVGSNGLLKTVSRMDFVTFNVTNVATFWDIVRM
jgi:hypothetical protein